VSAATVERGHAFAVVGTTTLRLDLYRAPRDDAPVVLYVHGGGWRSGDRADGGAERLAPLADLGVTVASVDYRLAPEDPFPAAPDDVSTVVGWLDGAAPDELRDGPTFVPGDSAGANLALGLINRLRATGETLPACAWLLSPWTDLTMSGGTLQTKDAIDPLIHKAYLDELAAAYAPPSADRRDPLISPLFAELKGFPPVLVQVGSAETLLDDAVRFARAAGLADVAVTLEVWPHMIHAWPMWNAKLADGRRALERVGQFVRQWVK